MYYVSRQKYVCGSVLFNLLEMAKRCVCYFSKDLEILCCSACKNTFTERKFRICEGNASPEDIEAASLETVTYVLVFLLNCNFKILIDFVKHFNFADLHVPVERAPFKPLRILFHYTTLITELDSDTSQRLELFGAGI